MLAGRPALICNVWRAHVFFVGLVRGPDTETAGLKSSKLRKQVIVHVNEPISVFFHR